MSPSREVDLWQRGGGAAVHAGQLLCAGQAEDSSAVANRITNKVPINLQKRIMHTVYTYFLKKLKRMSLQFHYLDVTTTEIWVSLIFGL